jgi:hypothetical protein
MRQGVVGRPMRHLTLELVVELDEKGDKST